MTDVHQLICAVARKLAASGPIDYLEIGVREGDSIASVMTEPGIRLAVGIDTWGTDAGGSGRGSPDHIVIQPNMLLITGSSHAILPGLRHKFDLIFIDGDHSLEGCMSDCRDCLPLLKPGGTIIVDDLDHPQHTYIRPNVSAWAAANGMQFTAHAAGYGVAEISSLLAQ